METPGSVARRVTRSQVKAQQVDTPFPKPSVPAKALATASAKKNRRALADVTNDSPISGLAPGMSKGGESPASVRTPASPREGEDVLRSQVKSLLQKIELEPFRAPLLRPLCQVNTFTFSPSRLTGPTPANTPADAVLTGNNKSRLECSSPVEEEIADPNADPCVDDSMEVTAATPFLEAPNSVAVSEVIDVVEHNSALDQALEKPTIRSLQFGSPKGNVEPAKVGEVDDDEGSNWSVAVNVSSPRAEEEVGSALKKHLNPWARRDCLQAEDGGKEAEEEYESTEEYDYYDLDDGEYVGDDGDDGGEDDCAELCRGLSGISVAEKKPLPAFAGKHIRYNYNSDDEVEEQVVCDLRLSPSVVKLNGLPTPKGKHLRFSEESSPGK